MVPKQDIYHNQCISKVVPAADQKSDYEHSIYHHPHPLKKEKKKIN